MAIGFKHIEGVRLQVATWKFSGQCSEHKQIGEVLVKNNTDSVAGQESSRKEEDGNLNIEGYKGFGKPCTSQNSQRGERFPSAHLSGE